MEYILSVQKHLKQFQMEKLYILDTVLKDRNN